VERLALKTLLFCGRPDKRVEGNALHLGAVSIDRGVLRDLMGFTVRGC
jgi:hypothetical protein